MKFSDVPNHSYFVVLDLANPSLLLAKDREGKVRDSAYTLKNDLNIDKDAEVQVVVLKI